MYGLVTGKKGLPERSIFQAVFVLFYSVLLNDKTKN